MKNQQRTFQKLQMRIGTQKIKIQFLKNVKKVKMINRVFMFKMSKYI